MIYSNRDTAIRESLLRHAALRAVLIRAEMISRVRLLRKCIQNRDARMAAIEQARRDPIWFINHCFPRPGRAIFLNSNAPALLGTVGERGPTLEVGQ